MSISELLTQYFESKLIPGHLRKPLELFVAKGRGAGFLENPTKLAENKGYIWSDNEILKLNLVDDESRKTGIDQFTKSSIGTIEPDSEGDGIELSGDNESIKRNKLRELIVSMEQEETIQLVQNRSLRGISSLLLVWFLIFVTLNWNWGGIFPVIIFPLCFIYTIYIRFTDRMVDQRYHGYSLNRLLHIMCNADPSRHLRDIPMGLLLMNILWFISALSVAMKINDSPYDKYFNIHEVNQNSQAENVVYDDVTGLYYAYNVTSITADSIYDCNQDNSCSVALYSGFTIGILYYTSCVHLLAFTTIRDLLTNDIHLALLSRIQSIEKKYPNIMPLLISTERNLNIKNKFGKSKPWVFWLTLPLAFAYGIVLFIQGFTDFDPHLFKGEVCGICVLSLVSLCVEIVYYTIVFSRMALSIWIVYESCYYRLKVLSRYFFRIHPRNINSLAGWWEIRCFYMDCLFPVAYRIANISMSSMIIILAFWVFVWVSDFLSQIANNATPADILRFSWYKLFFIFLAIGAIISTLLKMTDIIDEQSNQSKLIKRKLLEYSLSSTNIFRKGLIDTISDEDYSINVKRDNEPFKIANPMHNNFEKKEDHIENNNNKKKNNNKENKNNDDDNNDTKNDDINPEEVLNFMNEYTESFDKLPYLFGVPLTRPIVITIYTYIGISVLILIICIFLGGDSWNTFKDLLLQ